MLIAARRGLRLLSRRCVRPVKRAGRRVWRRSGRRVWRRSRRALRRRYRRHVYPRWVKPLKRDIARGRRVRYLHRKAMWGTPLRADLRAARTWRGERPRIAMRNYFNHPVWWSYRTHPPVVFAPSAVAELDHWINRLPEQVGTAGNGGSGARDRRRASRPHVLEVEHWCMLLAGSVGDQWERAFTQLDRINDRIRADRCRAVVTLSPGLRDHFSHFLAPDVSHKLDYAFPACPAQPNAPTPRRTSSRTPLTILVIANRIPDKGVPEALRAYEVLRARHGPRVRMILVSGWPHLLRRPVPEGVALCKTLRMSPAIKSRVHRAADVLLEPTFSDGLLNIQQAYSYGVPAIATRIHHGDAFVAHGESGFLVDSPVWAYNRGYGIDCRSWAEFTARLEAMRDRGELDGVVEAIVDRLEPMVTGDFDLAPLRAGARRLHAERFSPEARNARLRAIYARALST